MVTGVQSSANIPGSAADIAGKAQAARDALAANQAQAGVENALTDAQKIPVNPTLAAIERNQQAARDAKDVGAKVYHSFPGSSYFGKDGTRYEFDYKGELSTTNSEIQKDLDMVADKPGSPIYRQNPRATPAPGDDLPVKEIQNRAAETIAALRAQAQKV